MTMQVDPAALRVFVYQSLIAPAHMPMASDVAAHFGVTRDEAIEAIRGADIGKTLLPDPRTGEIWMAGPFSTRPTAYQVTAEDRRWWANCAWDMLGVAALVGESVGISARCTDCGDVIAFQLAPNDDTVPNAVVHFLLPARRWYEDIGFT
jgi:hypothetical protein